jgi:geranylgeranyl diphosphate synthase type II
MDNLKKYLKEKSDLIDHRIIEYIDKYYIEGRLKEASLHSLLAGGKRLRPVLCIAACEASGGSIQDCIHAACALEMIHTYSLIHDDLPAMDNDDLRRGKPTCHKQFDEATAILAGDSLLTVAFEILSDFSYEDAGTGLALVRLMSKAAGASGMIEGQMRDILSEGEQISLTEMEQLHKLKTGALITASVLAGIKCSKINQHLVEKKLTRYAEDIGLAFQVVDDILNIEGNAEIMGKATGTDQDLNKSTYPVHLGIEGSKLFAKKLVDDAINEISSFKSNAEPLRAIATYIIDRKL